MEMIKIITIIIIILFIIIMIKYIGIRTDREMYYKNTNSY